MSQEALEALEWPQVTALWLEQCRTPQGRALLEASAEAGAIFAAEPNDLRERLAETSEARTLLDAEELPPFGAITDVEAALRCAERGGILEIQQLVELRAVAETLDAVAGFLRGRRERAPRLGGLCDLIADQSHLRRDIDRCIDPAGEVRDSASPALARARRESMRLASDLQRRISRYLQQPEVATHLSDSFYTLRNDRYVLPVKADSRGRIAGIVHDASHSGATLFVEPEGVVDLNNQLKQAELSVVREIETVLRELGERVSHRVPELRTGLEALVRADLAFARGRLSQRMEAVEPQVDCEGVFDLPRLRHPLLAPAACVPNDVRLGAGHSVLVLSGPNAGGKTVTMKAIALAALFARAGLHVACGPGARVDASEAVLVDIGDHQDIGESLSTFSAHMLRLSEIVRTASRRCLVVIDEIGMGTDPSEGASLAQAMLESLADSGARAVTTTHYNLLKEMAEVDPRFCNASFEFDPETLAPTYRLRLGVPGVSSAAAVASRMGMPAHVLERATALLEREDRRLDRMLSELAGSRAALDSERQQAARLRAESEAVRDEYRTRLERLAERRDSLYRRMREDLDTAFAQAHAEVARVIRDLQRGPTSQQAARARSELQTLAERAEEAEARAGVGPAEHPAPPAAPVDWRRARPGDPVRLPSGASGLLVTLPDRRGRVSVRVGDAKLVLQAEVLARPADLPKPKRAQPSVRVRVERAEGESEEDALAGDSIECDLRGQRVDEALDRLAEVLDRAGARGCALLRVIHGFGTGALRKAVREHLAASPWVRELRPGAPDEGGDGVTLARLAG